MARWIVVACVGLSGCFLSHELNEPVDRTSDHLVGTWVFDYCSGAARGHTITICETGQAWIASYGVEGSGTLLRRRVVSRGLVLNLLPELESNALGPVRLTYDRDSDTLLWPEHAIDGWCGETGLRYRPGLYEYPVPLPACGEE